MSGPLQPLQRIGQALGTIGQLFGRRGPPPQRVYREPIGKPPATPYAGPINRPPPPEQQQRALFRVGFNPNQKGRIDPRTGEKFLTGTYPTKVGVEGTLRRVPDGRVQVRVYGTPAWDTRKHTSPPPDQVGNVYVTYFASKSELEAALAGPGDIQDWVFQIGSYNFDRVLTVYVGQP
jgi:hypothetical protein